MVGVPASGSPLSSFAAARTRYDRCARDWRVRDTFATTVGANLADDPIIAVDAILSVHFNLALTSRLLASTDGLYRIGTGKVRCDTTRTTGDRARAGTSRALVWLSRRIILSRSAVSVLLDNNFLWVLERLVASSNERWNEHLSSCYDIFYRGLRRHSSPVTVEVAEDLIDPLNLPAELKHRRGLISLSFHR